jgi:PKD repeat protein
MKKLTGLILLTLLWYINQAQSIAGFTASQVKGCAPLTVDFIDSSQGTPLSVEWNMGDGTTYNLSNIQHTFTDTGTYHVTYTVNDSFTSDTETLDVTVYNIISNFNSGWSSIPCPPLPVAFTNLSTPLGLSYTWHFGDGEPDTAYEPQHVYFLPGTYDVTLIAYDTFGCADTTTANNDVFVDGPLLQVAIDSGTGTVPFTVSISPTIQNAVQATIDWGDGQIDSISTTSHTYTIADTFSILITLVDSNGCVVYYVIDTIGASYTLATNEAITTAKILTYPNPFTDEVFISGLGDFEVVVTITNLVGQIVYTSSLIDNKISFPKELPAGQYLLNLKSEKSSYQSIITKQ